jgi:hypothetical protein
MTGVKLEVLSEFFPRGGGGDNMPEGMSPEIEVQRVMNLVRGFGWEKVKEEIIDDELHIEIKKKSAAAARTGPGPGPG